MHRPEKDCDLIPRNVHSRHKDKQREHKLQQSCRGNNTQFSPYVDRIEVRTVQNPYPHPRQEEDKIPMIEMAHTISGEHTMVLPFQHTYTTYSAVPGTRRRYGFTDSTIVPSFLPTNNGICFLNIHNSISILPKLRARNNYVSGTCINEPEKIFVMIQKYLQLDC